MVFKVSKGGVRSGNTLRGLQSRRTKLYGRHACLIGSSSLNLQDLNKLLSKSSNEDHLVGDTLRRTNVLLSLNKKQRWLVPAKINRMISSGSFNTKAMVSLLERHKLKRRANCVRFTSNSGKLPDVAPRHRKYFSFSLDTIDEEQSNREKKRVKAEEFKKQKSPKERKNGKPQDQIKVINAFTHHGRNINNNRPLESSKQEYRVEVFYPCPQSCSLTFNPKYTDVILEEGKSGELEVKANVKSPRSRQKHHRRHFTMKDLENCYDQIIEEDVNEMWDDFCHTDCEETTDQEHELGDSLYQSANNDLKMLIDQADKARKLCVQGKHQYKKVTFLSQNHYVKRPPLVYEEPKQDDIISDQQTSPSVMEIKALDFVKVILKSSETAKSSLEQRYGTSYSEGSCQPRRFMIDISDDVANLFSSTKSSSTNLLFVSYLVFIHDGCYDDNLDVFRVIFNSFSCKYLKSLSEYISFSQTSIDDIMNNLFGYLLDFKEIKEVQCQYMYPQLYEDVKGRFSFLHSCANLNVNTFLPSLAILEKTFSESFEEENNKEVVRNINTKLDQDVFCDICYDIINPTKLEAATGTKLRKCGHHCCDYCWASHFQSSIRDGKTKIICPGYDCSSEIGLVTLLSIIRVSDVALLLQRIAEKEVEKSENSKWCPNTACGRAIKIETDNKDFCQDIVCVCGTEICFECFGSTHWPAKCDQAKEYFQKLTTMKPLEDDPGPANMKNVSPSKEQKSTKSQVYEVEGRICPRCENFINKNGGCHHMVCKCGLLFCWNCMKPVHDGLCIIDENHVRRQTRIVRVCHKEQLRNDSYWLTSQRHPKIENAKKKATLYHHALQQRLDASSSSSSSGKSLLNKIVAAAQKDLHFKQEIFSTLENHPISETEEKLKTLSIKPQLQCLIKSSSEIKGILHHVAEFSYILIQDTPHSVEKQRILRLANDISGICSFIRSILDLGDNQNASMAFRRLIYMQKWAKRALDALIAATNKLRQA